MTLIFGCLLGLLLGAVLGFTRWTLLAAGLAWYVFLALQTAYLAHSDVTGFFGVNGLEAVQGGAGGQYWLAQPFILAIIVGLAWVGSRARSRLRRSKRQPLATDA
jgi:hypothetical protein